MGVGQWRVTTVVCSASDESELIAVSRWREIVKNVMSCYVM